MHIVNDHSPVQHILHHPQVLQASHYHTDKQGKSLNKKSNHFFNTFSNIDMLRFQPIQLALTHFCAICLAAILRVSCDPCDSPYISIHCRGGHAFGKSHCCPLEIFDVGTPPGKSRNPEFCGILSK